MANKNQIEDRKPVLRDAMLYYYLEFESEVLTGEDIKRLLDYADLDKVPDRVILLNDIYSENLDWSQLSNAKIARLISMFIDRKDVHFILDKVNLKENKFKIREIIWCIARMPELTENTFGIDLKKLTKKDAYTLLSLGHDYFIERIDISRYRFNPTEIYKIVKSYLFDRPILEKVKSKTLEGFHVSQVLINTGRDNIDLVELDRLTPSHWVEILGKRKFLFDLCDFSKFLEDDVIFAIKLVSIFPNYQPAHNFILKNKDTIGDKGWGILLELFPTKYISHCDYSALYEGTWARVLDKHPELVSYRAKAVKKAPELPVI